MEKVKNFYGEDHLEYSKLMLHLSENLYSEGKF